MDFFLACCFIACFQLPEYAQISVRSDGRHEGSGHATTNLKKPPDHIILSFERNGDYAAL